MALIRLSAAWQFPCISPPSLEAKSRTGYGLHYRVAAVRGSREHGKESTVGQAFSWFVLLICLKQNPVMRAAPPQPPSVLPPSVPAFGHPFLFLPR
jgi:hypothetical protein